jgi:disulfide bond formation protein DsbB
MLSELPLARALPRIFQGAGDCSAVEWTFFGLSIAAWSLVWFTILSVTLIVASRERA